MWENEEVPEIMTFSCSVTYLTLLWRILGMRKSLLLSGYFCETSAVEEAPFITGTTTYEAIAVPKIFHVNLPCFIATSVCPISDSSRAKD